LKLVRFRNDRRESYGIMSDDQIVCLCSFAENSKLDLPPSLEEYTLPGKTINVTIVRNNEAMTLPVNLGKRPSPSTA